MSKAGYFVVLSMLLFSCKSAENFTGYSYDPPNVTDTGDKEIEFQKKRTIGAGYPKVWASNEFDGARMNDFYAVNDSTFEVLIKPERAPINNSAWYGFSLWSDSARTITLRMNYENGRHRYAPKTEFMQNVFAAQPLDTTHAGPSEVQNDSTGVAFFKLDVGTLPVLVAAQRPYNSAQLYESLHSGRFQKKAEVRIAGRSNLNKPIYEVEIDETSPGAPAGVLIIVSRQHPPEVPGFTTAMYFLENLMADTPLAQEFRQHFAVKAYPMINPDGVDLGHWRNNATGNDLNRDWEFFNQPETRTVRDALLPLLEIPDRKVYYGIDFHSTGSNNFYPIDEEVVTEPDNLTQHWLELLNEANPENPFSTEEFPTDSPITKNWIYKTFGADAVTFEVGDRQTEDEVKKIAVISSDILMKLLLDEFYENNPGLKP